MVPLQAAGCGGNSHSDKVALMHVMFIHDKNTLVKETSGTAGHFIRNVINKPIFLKNTGQDGLYILTRNPPILWSYK